VPSGLPQVQFAFKAKTTRKRCGAQRQNLRPAGLAVPADFQARYGDAEVALLGHRDLEFFEQLALEFRDFSATQACHVHVIAAGTSLVEMPLALNVHQVQFVNQALSFQQADGPVHGNAVDLGIDAARFAQNLSGIEMLLGGFDNAQDGSTLAGQPYAAVHELRL
jgi:hypothetical protein